MSVRVPCSGGCGRGVQVHPTRRAEDPPLCRPCRRSLASSLLRPCLVCGRRVHYSHTRTCSPRCAAAIDGRPRDLVGRFVELTAVP